MEITTLKINPRVTNVHYQYYFNVSEATACRMLKTDKIVLNKRRISYLDFFALYEAFPDPKFIPYWVTISCPPKLSKLLTFRGFHHA